MCKINDAQIQADASAVATAITTIAIALATTDPGLADGLATAAKTLVAATANFKTGDAVDDINTAALAIEALLNAIPETAPYATFVGIAVAALDVLISNLSTQSVQTGDSVPDAVAVLKNISTLPENHFRGMVQIHRRWCEGPRSALIRTWNDQVEKQPGLGFPKL